MTNDNRGKTKTQYDRFIETARTLGCDEDEAVFDERLKAIVRQKPKNERQPPAPRRKTS